MEQGPQAFKPPQKMGVVVPFIVGGVSCSSALVSAAEEKMMTKKVLRDAEVRRIKQLMQPGQLEL